LFNGKPKAPASNSVASAARHTHCVRINAGAFGLPLNERTSSSAGTSAAQFRQFDRSAGTALRLFRPTATLNFQLSFW
jgi:hypothetical protein